MREVSNKAFIKAIDTCIAKDVDFVLISGDLFNTSMPPIESLSMTVKKLKELQDKNIPVYMIAGSHDYSPSHKTMLDVLVHAGLAINVAQATAKDNKLYLNFTIDKKTGAKITGMLGKRGGLEKSYYESLVREPLEKEKGVKIFLFHTALQELKPKEMADMDACPVSLLPKNFFYYAGGHVHIVKDVKLEGYGRIVYPGPLFPNSFAELEKLQTGGFYIVEDNTLTYEPIMVHPVHGMLIDADGKTPEQVEQAILKEMKNKEFFNTIITLRVRGQLKAGKPSDIPFKELFKKFYDKSAYFVMKNTSKLTSQEFEEIKVETGSVDEIEQRMIEEHTGKSGLFAKAEEKQMIQQLIASLSTEKGEGETNMDFDQRIRREVAAVLKQLGLQ